MITIDHTAEVTEPVTPQWSLPRRVAFRFGVVVAVIQMLPFPFDALPKMEWLTSRYADLWDWMGRGFGDLIGVVVPPAQPTGSGDTTAVYVQTVLQLLIGVVGAAIWSGIDERRRRTAYPRTATVVFTGLRYWLAFVMLSYGFAKVFKTQFPAPRMANLDHPVGEMSPMGLLWTFMGYSTPYTVFGGLAECLGATLLLWRRTTTMGALVLIAVLTNVVMLNFCYDVPVKLFSSILLVIAFVLAFPDLRRILAVLLGNAVPARPAAPRWSRRGEWIRNIVKLLLVGFVVVVQVKEQVDYRDQLAGGRSKLHGIYDVESYTVDGVEAPPKTRWRRLIIEATSAAVRTMADEATSYHAELDDAAHTLKLTRKDEVTTYTYTRPAADQLELDGPAGKHVHVVLHARDPEAFPLMSRTFNWIQELPFNR